jgi:hypothetical protein
VAKPPPLNVPPHPSSDLGTGNNNVLNPPPLNLEAPPDVNKGADRGGALLPPPGAGVPPPTGTGGHGGTGVDRSDSSGLLGGVKKPWDTGSPMPADPSGTKPPAATPEDWAAGPQGGSGGGNSGSQAPPPGAPMMPPPAGMGGQQGGPGADRPDSAGLIGGVKTPWKGEKPPAVDPSEVPPPPAVKPEDWAMGNGGDSARATPSDIQVPRSELSPKGDLSETPPAVDLANPAVTQQAQQMSGGGMPPPMMPPGAAGQAGAVAERSDSSGLLGGIREPWSGTDDAGGVGGTTGLVSPSMTPEKWAVTPVAAVPPPADVPEVSPGALPGGDRGSSEPVLPRPVEEQTNAWSAPLEAVVPRFAEPVAELELTSTAAPAWWAASSDVAPVAPHAAAGAVLGASAVVAAASSGSTAPLVPSAAPGNVTSPGATAASGSTSQSGTGPGSPRSGSAQSYPSEFPHVDADGTVGDDRDEDRAGDGLLLEGGAGPMPGVDSVVVVRPDDAVQDTSAWEAGGVDFLLPGVLMPVVVARSDQSGWDDGEQVGAFTLKSSHPWKPEAAVPQVTYQRRKAGEGPAFVDSFVAPLSCGDEYSMSADEREAYLAGEAARAEQMEEQGDEEAEDAEPAERFAADLLNESGSAWGGSKASQPTGVLE